MGMRPAAVVLLVSLVSPAVMTAVCELSCLQALHHAASAAATGACHEHRSGQTDGPAVSGSAVLCHDAAEAPAATTPATSLALFGPATAILPTALRPDLDIVRGMPRLASARAPDRLPRTTPLRI